MAATGSDPLRQPVAACFTLTGQEEGVREGLKQVMACPVMARLARSDQERAELLLAEALNNIARHAYAGTTGEIRLQLQLQGQMLSLRIEDEGVAMPGGRLPQGFPPAPGSLPEGGFGWLLIRSLASALAYQRQGLTNRLEITITCEQSCKPE